MGSDLRLPNLILSHKYWFLEFSTAISRFAWDPGPLDGEAGESWVLSTAQRSPLFTTASLQLRDHHHEPIAPYHSLIPDDRHLPPCRWCLRDQGEAVLSNGLLGRVEGTVSTAGHLEVATARNTQQRLYWSLPQIVLEFILYVSATEGF